MSDTDSITQHPEFSDAAERAIDAYIANFTAQRTADTEREAAKFHTAGAYRIARPTPSVELPEPAPTPLELPEQFAPFARDVEQAQQAAARVGLADRLPGVFGFLTGLQPNERVPVTASTEERAAMAERTMAALRERYGVERGEEMADHAAAAIKALGLTKIVAGVGADNHQEFIEHLAEVWSWRTRDGAA